MNKYLICHSLEDENEFYDFCSKNNIPFIVIKTDKNVKYRYISYDLITVKETKSEHIIENLADDFTKIYLSYKSFFGIPNGISQTIIIGSRNAGFRVRTGHAEFIADALFDYLEKYIKRSLRKKK
jgi:hypothetical protein